MVQNQQIIMKCHQNKLHHFRSNNKYRMSGDYNDITNQEKMQRVELTKFLGVIINSSLIWSDHIITVSNKISKSLGTIGRIRNKLPRSTVISLLFTPTLLTAISFGPEQTLLNYLSSKFAKKVLRTTSFASYNSRTSRLFQNTVL